MKVSAVGFLFQDKIKGNGLKGKNYTCIIHKVNPEGNYNKNVISSPIVKESVFEVVSPESAKADVLTSLFRIKSKDTSSKFVGATIKDGIRETEIHSLLSDKIFAVRTRDSIGRNHFRILGKNKTQELLSRNLYLNA